MKQNLTKLAGFLTYLIMLLTAAVALILMIELAAFFVANYQADAASEFAEIKLRTADVLQKALIAILLAQLMETTRENSALNFSLY